MQTSFSSRRVLASCFIIILVLCLCLSLTSIILAGFIYLSQSGNGSISFRFPEIKTGESQLDTDQQIKLIESQVSEIRGWEPKSEINQQFITQIELRQHVLDGFFVDYSSQEAEQDALMLWTFGLLDKNFDLYNFYIDLYSEQIAGFYDQKNKQMYVVQDNEFAGPERITYAHEFVHALQDQYYDIENGLNFNDEFCKKETERCAAVSALLEGDASLSEAFWFSSYATAMDQREISKFYSSFSSPVYDQAPAFMKEDFLFPYQEGQKFVENLYNLGGWEYVNEAFGNPPISTEQILHPEKYPGDIPETVTIPDLKVALGPRWEEIDRGTMGEWYTYLILAAGLDESGRISQSESAGAADGWDGDTYAVFYNATDDKVFMVFLTKWENVDEMDEFRETFTKYAKNRFGDMVDINGNFTFWESIAGIQSFWADGEYSAWCITPDREILDSIWPMIEIR